MSLDTRIREPVLISGLEMWVVQAVVVVGSFVNTGQQGNTQSTAVKITFQITYQVGKLIFYYALS